MDTGRLGVVRKQESHHTKYVMMVNDVIKNRWENLDNHLSREKGTISLKMSKQTMAMRRIVVRQRILNQCMKMKKDAVVRSKGRDIMLGQYGGRSLPAFSRDIDQTIAYMHPKLRRLRKVKKQISESFEKGKIVDPEELTRRVNEYFEKHWKKEEVKKPVEVDADDIPSKDIFARSRKTALPPIRGIVPVNPAFYKFVEDESKEGENKEQPSVDRLNIDDEKKNDNVTNDNTKPSPESQTEKPNQQEKESTQQKSSAAPVLEKKSSFVLPPIVMTKEYAKKR